MRHPRLFIAIDSTDVAFVTTLCNAARTFACSNQRTGSPGGETRGARSVGVKIGLEAFYGLGTETIATLTDGLPLFLDLKLHDIPNTVAKGLGALVQRLSPRIITVHATGGEAMLTAAAGAQRDPANLTNLADPTNPADPADPADLENVRLDIAAVTLLTSLGDKDLSIFGSQGAEQTVVDLARLVQRSECRALVCSGHEVAAVKRAAPTLWTVVPGIRLDGDDTGDQARVMTPQMAIAAGADSLVMGRSITTASDPMLAIKAVMDSLESTDRGWGD